MTRLSILSLKSQWAALSRDRKRLCIAAVLIVLALLFILQARAASEPEPIGGPPMVRRLTEAQYRASMADIFGPGIPITARFEKPVRADGLIAIGTGEAGMSPFAVEQYDAAAQSIAAAVLSKERRHQSLSCRPKSEAMFDEACARSFLTEKGRLLFRRPLTSAEADKYVRLARSAHSKLGSFHEGLELSLYTMLVSPHFLFRIEQMAAGSDEPAGELDAFSKASRISFFLTNSAPDDELLRAAEAGELDHGWGLRRQVDRLMKSKRFEEAVRAFFADMLQFERFDDLSKDPAIYPAFNSDVAADAQEQTLRTIVDHLLTKKGDYRDLFTTRDTFLTRSLGVIYRTPVPTRGGWDALAFDKDGNRAGIQSHVSFLALHSHPGRSSPTLRGYAVREVFLCQQVPDPPANVNFSAIEEKAHARMVTARDRLALHSTEPSCAGCHKVMDPLGLTMENYDGLGTFRTQENGARINTVGSLDGTDFNTTDGLAKALRNHPETPRCVAERLYKSAVGRDIVWGERYYLDWLIAAFEKGGYRIPDLMRRIVLSENFFTVTRPAPVMATQRLMKSNKTERDRT
ncbi:DUF1592 domain-containing protein [Phenylobacterium sp. LjRoot225]|uniref:DUF1592 domain-containing protein n=1 Tax=Phenylobacterium sp. LjRoot225 TaxID=3342285 RepID=UPI003ECE6640